MDEERRKIEIKDEKRIDKDITDRRLSEDSATTYQIKRKAKTFIILARLSSRDEEDDISDILEEVHKKFPKDHEYIVEADLHKFLKVDEEDAKLLVINGGRGAEDDDSSYRIVVKEIENVIKMGVHFEHIIDIADVTHSQCFVAKNDKKSKLLLEIKQILREFKSKSS
ncbi:hypothetical protein Ancab_012136 [Ancistrocladus abbreviatus]